MLSIVDVVHRLRFDHNQDGSLRMGEYTINIVANDLSLTLVILADSLSHVQINHRWNCDFYVTIIAHLLRLRARIVKFLLLPLSYRRLQGFLMHFFSAVVDNIPDRSRASWTSSHFSISLWSLHHVVSLVRSIAENGVVLIFLAQLWLKLQTLHLVLELRLRRYITRDESRLHHLG